MTIDQEVPAYHVRETKVERREDGMVITYYTTDGQALEQYLTFAEFFAQCDQFKAMLEEITP